jgi:hypothetical protein
MEEIMKEKIPISVLLMAGWPLLLIGIGGAIGGALGGLAFGINLSLYKSNMNIGLKIVLNILTGCAAFLLWFFIASAIGRSRG